MLSLHNLGLDCTTTMLWNIIDTYTQIILYLFLGSMYFRLYVLLVQIIISIVDCFTDILN